MEDHEWCHCRSGHGRAAPAQRVSTRPNLQRTGIFQTSWRGVDYELADLPREIKAHNIGYNKAFLVWGILSREIGREKFQRILRQINQRYAFQHVTMRELWRAIERGAGRNLHWFFQQWFERRGAPEYQLTWKQSGKKVSGTITQAAPYYRATMQIEIQGGKDQRVVREVRVSGAETEFAVPVKFRVQSITLDPHYLVLRWTPEYHAAAEAARSGKAISK